MYIISRLASVALAILLGACSIHPLPEDVTRLSTYEIVKQIRCETRQAVFDATIQWLEEGDVGPKSRAVGASFSKSRRPISELRPEILEGRERRVLAFFWNTGVAYNYVLEMQEDNGVGADLSFLKLFTPGTGTLGVKAGVEKYRKNIRTFTITDTFGDLISTTPDDHCDGYIREANYTYPITGKIGMEGVVKDFVRLSLFANLDGRTGEPATNPKGPPTLVDALEFQTKFSGTLTPKIEFTPVDPSALKTASLSGSASRRDLHKVTVGLAIDPRNVPAVSDLRRSYYFGSLLTAYGKTASTRAAAEAVNQAVTTNLLARPVVINP